MQQRTRSQDERKAKRARRRGRRARRPGAVGDCAGGAARRATFVGYDAVEIDTQVDGGATSRRRARRGAAARVAVLRRVGRPDLRSAARSSARAGASTSTTCARSTDGRRRSARSTGDVPLRPRRRRACRAIGGATPSAITRRRICCTRRCARCWASACTRRARSSRPIGCASTSRITVRCTPSSSREIEAIVNREIWRARAGDVRARCRIAEARARGRDGAVRREVRRRRARRDDPGLLDGAVRRHARAQHGGDRAVQDRRARPAWRRACAASRR